MRKIYSGDRYTQNVLWENENIGGYRKSKNVEEGARCTLTIMKTKYHPDNDSNSFVSYARKNTVTSFAS